MRGKRNGSGQVKSFCTVFPLNQFEAVCCPLVAMADSKLCTSVIRLEGGVYIRLTSLSFGTYLVGTCFPAGADGKESACNAGDPSSILGLGRSPGEGNGNPLQYSCLENSMDRGTWQATVHGVTKSRTRLRH